MPNLNVLEADLDRFIKTAHDDYPFRDDESVHGPKDEQFSMYYEIGNTYIKVVEFNGRQHMVHSFIVNKPTKGFIVGDILKPAGWKAPATNFARGNITIPATYADRVRWTGVF
jgi:hypothetical protein